MPNKSYRNAIKEAIESEMRRDPSVIVVGEDVRGGHGGKNTDDNKLEGFGGVLGVTKGLWTEFGSERVIDTPITESAIIGMAAGAAATGLRPAPALKHRAPKRVHPRQSVSDSAPASARRRYVATARRRIRGCSAS